MYQIMCMKFEFYLFFSNLKSHLFIFQVCSKEKQFEFIGKCLSHPCTLPPFRLSYVVLIVTLSMSTIRGIHLPHHAVWHEVMQNQK